MPDWFDKLISLLGLDANRPDRIQGITLRQLAPMRSPSSGETIQVSLCRLEDGRTQGVFQLASAGDHWIGFLPCSEENARLLQAFLTQARRQLFASEPQPPSEGGFQQLGETPPAVLGTLPHRHLETGIELRLLHSPAKGLVLHFGIYGPRGRLAREFPWTPELADWWDALGEVVAANRTNWTVGPGR